MIEQVRRKATHRKINILDVAGQRIEDMMQPGQNDLLIAFPEFTPKSCVAETLFAESYLCISSKDRALPDRNLTAAELSQYPHIAVSQSRPTYRDSIDELFEDHGYARQVVVTAPCFSLMPDYIRRTDAVAFLPSPSFDQNKFTVENVESGPKGFDVQAAWHKRIKRCLLHNWMLGILKSRSKILGLGSA